MAETIALVSSVFGCLTVAVTLASPCLRVPLSEKYDLFRTREKNLRALLLKRNELEQKRSNVDQESKEKVVHKFVKIFEWLEKTEEIIKDAAAWKFEESIHKKYCCGLPNYRSQYKAGKQISEKIDLLDELITEGEKFINLQGSDVVGKLIRSSKLVGETAISTVEEIKNCVLVEEVKTIRVYGMAGLGKSNVVSQVNDMILQEEDVGGNSTRNGHFHKVLFVTVNNQLESTKASIEDLQRQIAEKLQVDLHRDNGSSADDVLASALANSRFLIILDDMQTELSLEAIGIPTPTKENRCKVIVVSRSRPMCSDIHIDKKFEIKPLSVAEAQELFESEAGIKLSKLGDDTRAIAEKMIAECDGYPITVILLAQNLKDLMTNNSDDVDEAWKKALNGLKGSPVRLESMNKRAFTRLKHSYDMLKKESQRCFLYCALYPSDHTIERRELLEYWFCEGLLNTRKRDGRIEDMIQAKEILDELVGAYLLETVNQEGGKEAIKMRSLAKQMAVHLTKTSPQFLTKAGEELNMFPFQGEWLHDVERASLMRNQFKFLRGEPKWPKLTTLLLQHNPIGLYLDDNFFCSMPNINVLDLSYTDITSLPEPSFSKLTKLSALLLHHCHNLKTLPSLKQSRKLLILDISDSPVEQLPVGMNNMAKLIRLNMSRTNVKIFPAKLAPALVNLEELIMITNDSGFSWGKPKGAPISELRSYQKLAILYANFLNVESFVGYIIQHLCPPNFKFGVGGSCEEKLPENSIVFKGNFLVNGEPVLLPEHTSELHVICNEDLPCLQVTCHLKNLKVINICDCRCLVYLFTIDMFGNLPNLETVSVEKCPKMVSLIKPEESDDDMIKPRLKQLKVIRIFDCKTLVYLFNNEILHYFPELVEISIKQCQMIEVVIESQEPNVYPAVFPKLKELVLADLQELKCIYKGEMKWQSRVNIWNCPALKGPMITSMPAELLSRPSGSNQLQRSYSLDPNETSLLDSIDINANAAEAPESVGPKFRNAAKGGRNMN
ncbi:probable disease resistance protein At4g27220 [Argentina anserina]|uniref:probable disease resistance protein At4g27220 n=1 Tax=Argentina anserina TaxID=57926 RepID=UPI0021767994|nr:probable disease resistance protein At4g27220 [Potentilla anserina]